MDQKDVHLSCKKKKKYIYKAFHFGQVIVVNYRGITNLYKVYHYVLPGVHIVYYLLLFIAVMGKGQNFPSSFQGVSVHQFDITVKK